MKNIKKDDIYVIHSKFKTFETVKVKKVKGDIVECVVLEGSPQWIGDDITLSLSKSDFAAFVTNEYIPTFWDKVKSRSSLLWKRHGLCADVIMLGIVAAGAAFLFFY